MKNNGIFVESVGRIETLVCLFAFLHESDVKSTIFHKGRRGLNQRYFFLINQNKVANISRTVDAIRMGGK